jgi:hypothetical protein
MNSIAERQNTAVAPAGGGNFFEQYSQAASGSRIVGQLLRFNKGDWLVGQEQDDVPPGTRLIANVGELMIGWNKWVGGVVEDMRMGRVVDGFQPPARSSLGDTDQSEWEMDDDGNPRDPWQRTNYLILKDEKSDQLYTFAANSKGGINAIGELCGHYGKRIRQHPDDLPVISLGAGKYQHKNKAYGWIKFPKLDVVDWVDREAFVDAMAAEQAAHSSKSDDDTDEEELPEVAPVAAARNGRSSKAAAAAAGTTRF